MKRDFSIDSLRFIGIVGIFLSHASSPPLIMNLRNFDVSLMVFVSAICMTYFSRPTSYTKYLKSRIIRLWFPVVIFVLGYYIISPNSFPFTKKDAPSRLLAALFLYTPTYLWILRVFLLMSLVTPLFTKYISRINDKKNFLIIIISIIVNEVLTRYAGNDDERYLRCVCIMTLGYAIISYAGITIAQFSNMTIFKIGISFICIFVILVILLRIRYGHFVNIQSMKYPPRLYYICFGLACSSLLYATRNRISYFIHNSLLRSFISFIGSHTLWIYLWHIPIITHFMHSYTWHIRFFIIFFIATIITYIQTKIIEFIDNKYKLPILKKVFIG